MNTFKFSSEEVFYILKKLGFEQRQQPTEKLQIWSKQFDYDKNLFQVLIPLDQKLSDYNKLVEVALKQITDKMLTQEQRINMMLSVLTQI